MTEAKQELIGMSESGELAEIKGQLEARKGRLSGDLHRLADIREALCIPAVASMSDQRLAAYLKKCGCKNLGQKRFDPQGPYKTAIWAIRDVEKWSAATEGDIAEYLVQETNRYANRRSA